METFKLNGLPANKIQTLLAYLDTVDDIPDYYMKRSGEEMDRLLDIVSNTEYMMPVGVEWDTTSNSPTLRRIDINGNTINPSTTFFDNHWIWGGIGRCVRSRVTGNIYFGGNAKGSGLGLDGTAGDVLVKIPVPRTSYIKDGDFRKFYEIPYIPTDTRYKMDYAGVQRGGIEQPYIYVGAFEAYGYLDGSTFKLGSASGKQPVTGAVSYPDLPNSDGLTMDDAEDYANNIGTGFGITNVHTWSLIQRLMMIEYGTFNLQSALGKGVVDLDAGTGFAGKLTGADSIYSNLAANGTGVGSGSDGQTPICWRGIENPYGNVGKYIIGINASESSHLYSILSRSGTSGATLSAVLGTGTFETGVGTLPTAGTSYITGIQSEELGALSLIPSTVVGSSSTYLCDAYQAPTNDPSICLAGGSWSKGSYAGIAYKSFSLSPTFSGAASGCRIEYVPQP